MNGLDVNLVMVLPNHPLLDHRLLEAEAAGLLDRMLAVLQDNSRLVTPKHPLSADNLLTLVLTAMPSLLTQP